MLWELPINTGFFKKEIARFLLQKKISVTAPGVPHAIHMPSHIYIGVGKVIEKIFLFF